MILFWCGTLSLLMTTKEALVDRVDQDKTALSDCTESAVWSLIYTAHIFYAPASIDRGHIVLPVSVCPSVLSAEI